MIYVYLYKPMPFHIARLWPSVGALSTLHTKGDRSLTLVGNCSHFWDRALCLGEAPIPVTVYLNKGLFTYTETGMGFGALSRGIYPRLIHGYSYTVQKVHTAHKRGQIPVPRDRSVPLNGYCSHFWDRALSPSPGEASVPVSVYVN